MAPHKNEISAGQVKIRLSPPRNAQQANDDDINDHVLHTNIEAHSEVLAQAAAETLTQAKALAAAASTLAAATSALAAAANALAAVINPLVQAATKLVSHVEKLDPSAVACHVAIASAYMTIQMNMNRNMEIHTLDVNKHDVPFYSKQATIFGIIYAVGFLAQFGWDHPMYLAALENSSAVAGFVMIGRLAHLVHYNNKPVFYFVVIALVLAATWRIGVLGAKVYKFWKAGQIPPVDDEVPRGEEQV